MKKSFIISIIITIIATGIAIWFYMVSEGSIPIHWNIYGEVDGYGSPATIFLFPGTSLFTIILFLLIPKIDPKGENIKKSGPLLPLLMFLISGLMFGLEIITIMTTNNPDTFSINIFISLLLAVLFVVMGYYLPLVKHNYMLGIRTPWTLYSEDIWVKTHIASRYWFIGVGVLFLICMFIKEPYNLAIPLISMTVVLIGILAYSYILFVSEKKSKK